MEKKYCTVIGLYVERKNCKVMFVYGEKKLSDVGITFGRCIEREGNDGLMVVTNFKSY